MSQDALDRFIALVRADPAWRQTLQRNEGDALALAELVRRAGFALSDEEVVWLTTCQDWMGDEPPAAGEGAPPLGVWG